MPRATILIAVSEVFKPITHPSNAANSPTIAVITPMNHKETIKAGHPFHILAGGTHAKRTFQPIATKCTSASAIVISSMIPFSST